MDRLAFTAVVAINEQRVARQMATNEMANVATVGFKRSFESSTRAIKIEGAGLPRYQPQSFTEDYIQMKAGPLMATGNPLDVALSGSTVLGVTARKWRVGLHPAWRLAAQCQGSFRKRRRPGSTRPRWRTPHRPPRAQYHGAIRRLCVWAGSGSKQRKSAGAVGHTDAARRQRNQVAATHRRLV